MVQSWLDQFPCTKPEVPPDIRQRACARHSHGAFWPFQGRTSPIIGQILMKLTGKLPAHSAAVPGKQDSAGLKARSRRCDPSPPALQLLELSGGADCKELEGSGCVWSNALKWLFQFNSL